MVRNLVHWIALGLALLMILFVLLLSFRPAYAQTSDLVVAPSSIWFDVWQIVQPVVVLLVSTVGPVLVTWISARLIALLRVTDENKRLEIEARLREALHQSATNGLKFALTKVGATTLASLPPQVIASAADYVRQKNPDALGKLNVDDAALRDIIFSKVPDVLGAGASISRGVI